MGGFGVVAGNLANDYSIDKQQRQTVSDNRTALAQSILSQRMRDQLEQQRLGLEQQQGQQRIDLEKQANASTQFAADRTYQLAKASHEIAGWESNGVPYQDKNGNWHEDWVKPSTGEKKTYDIEGTPGDIVKADQQADARYQSQQDMEKLRQKNRLELRDVINKHMDAYKQLSTPGKGFSGAQWQTLKNMPAWKTADLQYRMAISQLNRVQAVRDRNPTLMGDILGGASSADLDMQEQQARDQAKDAQATMQQLYDNFTKGTSPPPTLVPASGATFLKQRKQ